MDTLLTPEGLFSTGTVLAGVLVFTFAPYLPSVFPPSFARLVGFAAVCSALVPLWILSGSWQMPALVAACCLCIMVGAHLVQTRRSKKSPEDS